MDTVITGTGNLTLGIVCFFWNLLAMAMDYTELFLVYNSLKLLGRVFLKLDPSRFRNVASTMCCLYLLVMVFYPWHGVLLHKH